jgi:hypothetical protein
MEKYLNVSKYVSASVSMREMFVALKENKKIS